MRQPGVRVSIMGALLFLGMILLGAAASAGVIPVGPAVFPAESTLITFDGLASGTEVNGLTVSGVQFNYSLGNGMVVIDGGPGITNNISPPNVVSIRNNSGVLTMILPSPASLFGYGYAILSSGSVTNATTISLFSGATPVGTLAYSGSDDPTFSGGFAGIQSTIPFDRVAVTFNSLAAPAFALDNIRIAAVPEPSTLLLVMAGAVVLFRHRRT